MSMTHLEALRPHSKAWFMLIWCQMVNSDADWTLSKSCRTHNDVIISRPLQTFKTQCEHAAMTLRGIGVPTYYTQTFGIGVFKILADTCARTISVHTAEQTRNARTDNAWFEKTKTKFMTCVLMKVLWPPTYLAPLSVIAVRSEQEVLQMIKEDRRNVCLGKRQTLTPNGAWPTSRRFGGWRARHCHPGHVYTGGLRCGANHRSCWGEGRTGSTGSWNDRNTKREAARLELDLFTDAPGNELKIVQPGLDLLSVLPNHGLDFFQHRHNIIFYSKAGHQ